MTRHKDQSVVPGAAVGCEPWQPRVGVQVVNEPLRWTESGRLILSGLGSPRSMPVQVVGAVSWLQGAFPLDGSIVYVFTLCVKRKTSG